MNEHEQAGKSRRGRIAAVLSAAALAVALPVGVAVASGGSEGSGSTGGAATTQVQDEASPRGDSPRDKGDCPENDGSGRSGSDTSVEL
jgi:hypothetical protein